MADIADKVEAVLTGVTALNTTVEALNTTLTTLATAVQAIQQPPAPTVDFTPVLNAIAGLQTTLNTVAADLEPTPAAGGAAS